MNGLVSNKICVYHMQESRRQGVATAWEMHIQDAGTFAARALQTVQRNLTGSCFWMGEKRERTEKENQCLPPAEES